MAASEHAVSPQRREAVRRVAVWQNVEALAASGSVAAAIRVQTIEATDGVVRPVEEYGLVASSARRA
jgi:hypothetical protein